MVQAPSPSRAPLSRAHQGRWLGGVCAGLAPVRDIPTAWLRLAFVAAALMGGIGVALYLACWLIMPVEGELEPTGSPRVVGVARACAVAVGLGALALVAATATVFGFGWVVASIAALALGAGLWWPRRGGPAWALLPVMALTLPAVAVAASGLHLLPRTASAVIAPATAGEVRGTVYRSGLDTMLIDLRRTALPASGVVPLRIEAGVRRTIVALPANRCVHVVVDYHVHLFAVRLAALLSGRTSPTFSNLVLFGRLFPGTSGVASGSGSAPGPRLVIEFASQGGSLYVRDYPAGVDPDVEPDWPGYPVHPEPRPDTRGVPRRAAQALLRNWRARLAVEEQSARRIDALMPGPCLGGGPA